MADLMTDTEGGDLHITVSATIGGVVKLYGDMDRGALRVCVVVEVDGIDVYRSGPEAWGGQFAASVSVPGKLGNRRISVHLTVQCGTAHVSSLALLALGTKR